MAFMKTSKYKLMAVLAIIVFISLYSCANNQAAQKQGTAAIVSHHQYWYGDGGKGIRIVVLEPTGKGLSEYEKWILSMVQSSITGDFQKYSAMTVIDRQNLEKILSEQKQFFSGNYSEKDYVSIGKLTNARYVLAGSIIKTSGTYMLELAVTDIETGERKASYPPRAVTPSSLESLSAIKEAAVELLKQLGVILTEQGYKELISVANIGQVKAETALAKGITAQKQGTVVEALSYFIQASSYDSGLAEAASRMNILSANISSGNIGEDTRNDISWRRQWVTRLQETETFFANTLKGPQPYYIVYSTDIKQGRTDYQKETTELSVWVGFFPDFAWSNQINGVLNAVRNGLQATGRAEIWGLNWPAKTISTASPFINQTKKAVSTAVIEILNEDNKSIGRQTIKAPYGFEVKDTVVTPLWQWEGTVLFTAVDANLITDKLTIRVASIDGIAAENASRQKMISVMPETEWETALRINQTTKRYIEEARTRLWAEDLRKQADDQLKNGDTYLAITNYTAAIRLNPNDAMAFNGRGNAYLRDKNYYEAIADWETALTLNSSLPEAKRNIATVRQQLQREQERQQREAAAEAARQQREAEAAAARQREQEAAAARQWEQLQRDPTYHYNQGLSYHNAKNYTQALKSFTEAIRLNPNYASAYFYRGYAYGELKSYDQAIAEYTQAIRLNPNYAAAYNNRGWAYETKGNIRNIGWGDSFYRSAKEDYDAALRLDPGNTLYISNANRIRSKTN